ncbi:hypothetical protein NMG60_11027488 [Bertholletia excelsa]
MAASSPSTGNNSSIATPSLVPPAAAVATTVNVPTTNASKNLRGLNKPKCIKCGNVARSRCPYQSCKSCCAKAQNPCHIHVLKTSATFSDKILSSSASVFDQQSTEASPSGTSHRVSSLRQLSNNFAQFNNLQSPLRSRKPLTRKDAAAINEWRFLKLKEYKEGNIEVENEAFGRYMQNISLLEEVLAISSLPEEPAKEECPILNENHNSIEDSTEMVVAGLKLKHRSNPTRTENLRKRVQDIVDQGLKKLLKISLNDGANKQDEPLGEPEKGKTQQAERDSAFNELLEKLNKARNEEDLKTCLEMKSQIFNQPTGTSQTEPENTLVPKGETAEQEILPGLQSNYSPPKWFSTGNVDQDALNHISMRFCSLEEIHKL